jgi:hypothetical protein
MGQLPPCSARGVQSPTVEYSLVGLPLPTGRAKHSSTLPRSTAIVRQSVVVRFSYNDFSRSFVEWNIYDTFNDTTDVSLVVGKILWNEVCDEYDGERIRKV